MSMLWQDVRYGWRGLVRQPGFACLAILTLALGIGAATTIFSVIQNVLLDPFPYRDADRVVAIQIHDASSANPGGRTFFQTAEFLDYQEQTHVFEDVIAGTFEDVLHDTGEGTEQFAGGRVSPNLFAFLGVPAQVGRTLTPEDAKAGASPVFVMSYKMWRARYSLDPSILGRVFVLNGVPTTLVGMMPQRFTKLNADLWRPIVLDRGNAEIKDEFFMFQARLKPGLTLQQAQADVDVVAHRLAQTYPKNYPKQFTVNIISWVDSLVGQFRRTLYTLAAAVGLLLLIACGNVANMLLAKGSTREREMAIRVSLGAKRARIVRQLIVESLLLAAGGAGIGCLFAFAGVKGLVRLIPDGLIPHEAIIRLNVPVLIFSLVVAVATVLLFGLLPALQTARHDMVDPLKDSGKGVSGGFRRGTLRNALVIVEVALSLMLLAGAGLLMRNFVKLQTVDLGFDPDNVLVARVPLPRGQYDTAIAKQRFFESLLPRLQALPGVVAVAETTTLPPYGGMRTPIEIIGKPHAERQDSLFHLSSEGYLETLRLKIARGRPLSEADVSGARRVAVVNQTFVSRYFEAEDPLGRQVKIPMLETQPQGAIANPVFEIIGVITDVKNQGIKDPPMPEMLIPYTVTGIFERGILVRTASNPASLFNSVRKEIWAVNRNVALSDIGTLNGYLTRFSYAEPRFSLVVLGVFAGVGLILVAIGVYSVIAYTVSRQTQEIGIRMALGARRSDVLGMVIRMGLRLVAAGLLVGLLVSLGVTRLLTNQLWDISPNDPLTLVAVLLIMAGAGTLACYVPARRATRVDPMVALRYE